MKDNMLEINDIKPLVQIPDYTIYIYYILICLAVLFVVSSSYILYTYFKNKKESNEKRYFRKLKNLDISHTKDAAYTISKYGRLIAKDERSKELILELHKLLDDFKYKKEVSKEFPNEIKVKYDIFMESLDVK
ncbi:MAG: hypothetical protein U9Q33_03760 [Campylobacterota bacterium]|nr:hypothetical protein [Campylobacterota bacterium]